MDETGCYLCKYLEYYKKDSYEDSSPEGYYCDFRDNADFETFLCLRKLKCMELKDGE